MKKILFIMILYISVSQVKSQDFENDSIFKTLNMKYFDSLTVLDTLEYMAEDYYDSISINSTSSPTPDLETHDMTKSECRDRMRITANYNIDLRQKDWNYIRIFYDDFNKLDKTMWQSSYKNKGNNYNYTDMDPCDGTDNTTSQCYLNENESVNNGCLEIKTEKNPIEVPWNYTENRYDQWSTSTKSIFYRSARVESTWAFDGNIDIIRDGDNTSLGPNEGGIYVISKLKYPTDKGLWPAFWMMGYEDNGYDEIDMFEIFNSHKRAAWHDWRFIATTYYSDVPVKTNGQWGWTKEKCEGIKNPSGLTKGSDNLSPWGYWIQQWNPYTTATAVRFEDPNVNSMLVLANRHQFSRKNRIGKFPESLESNKEYNVRSLYNRQPMRINYNTGVYCGFFGDVNTKMIVDFVTVYKKFPCATDRYFNNANDFKIQPGVYNVEIAKKAYINLPINSSNPIPDDEIFKIISNDVVNITNIDISKFSNLIIEHTSHDLCSNMIPSSENIELGAPINNTNKNENNSTEFNGTKQQVKTASKVDYTLNNEKSTIECNQYVKQFAIFDIAGKLMVSKVNIPNTQTELNKLPNGIYIIVLIDNDNKRINRKIIKNAN